MQVGKKYRPWQGKRIWIVLVCLILLTLCVPTPTKADTKSAARLVLLLGTLDDAAHCVQRTNIGWRGCLLPFYQDPFSEEIGIGWAKRITQCRGCGPEQQNRIAVAQMKAWQDELLLKLPAAKECQRTDQGKMNLPCVGQKVLDTR